MDQLKKNPLLAYGVIAVLVVLIIVVIYLYYSNKKKSAEKYSGITPSPNLERYSGITPSPNLERYSGITPSPNLERYSGITPSPNLERYSGITPSPNLERMTASILPDSRSDRDYMTNKKKEEINSILRQYGLPATKELFSRNTGTAGIAENSTENKLYRSLYGGKDKII